MMNSSFVPSITERELNDVIVDIRQIFAEEGMDETFIQQIGDMCIENLNGTEFNSSSTNTLETDPETNRSDETAFEDSDVEMSLLNNILSPFSPISSISGISGDSIGEVQELVEASQRDGDSDESLNSNDDISESEEEDTDNIIMCQYVTVKKRGNFWKIHLKSGIMRLAGNEYVFKEAFLKVRF